MKSRALLVLGGFTVLVALSSCPVVARAGEPRVAITPMILDLIAPPVESSDAVLNQMLRESLPAPRRPASAGRVLPDGSVQYGEGNGSVIITVRNPCPEAYGHYDGLPRPLPGRGVRN